MGLEPIMDMGLKIYPPSIRKVIKKNLPDKPKELPPNPPAIPQGGGDAGRTGRKETKYRPAAQIFSDEDLRLGVAGRLGG